MDKQIVERWIQNFFEMDINSFVGDDSLLQNIAKWFVGGPSKWMI